MFNRKILCNAETDPVLEVVAVQNDNHFTASPESFKLKIDEEQMVMFTAADGYEFTLGGNNVVVLEKPDGLMKLTMPSTISGSPVQARFILRGLEKSGKLIYTVKTIEAAIPDPLPIVDTDLWKTTSEDESGFYDTFNITIPAGCNVILVGASISGSESGEPCYCGMNSSNKSWFYASGENSVTSTAYIGVTPLKTYRVTVDYGSEVYGNLGRAFIRYSTRINSITPNITDY